MRVALVTTFAASRKEPLADNMDRIHQAFLNSGVGEPVIRFTFADGLAGRAVSSVDRVLRRHPELERFVTSAASMPGIPGARRISNGATSPASGESVPHSTLRAIAAGVPRSFPFHNIVIHFHSPEFGDLVPTPMSAAETMSGVLLSDSWWVNGRVRSVTACAVVDADPASKKLPQPPPAVAVRLPGGAVIASANPEAVRAVQGIVADYRGRLKEIVERAALPHDLPSVEAGSTALHLTSGPRKPALERVFKPMGYSCRGNSGTFNLRRRTGPNLTLDVFLDVGTWSNLVLAFFIVWGVGFKARLPLPVSATAVIGAQLATESAGRRSSRTSRRW